MNITKQTKQQIADLVKGAMEGLAEFTVEIPANSANGDFSCNAALVSAKALGMPPRKIAEQIIANLGEDSKTHGFEKIEIAGPGFLNFFVEQKWYDRAVKAIAKQGAKYGKGDFGVAQCGTPKRVLLEFVSANPTGPMHIGNARGGALGDCLASVLEFAGYEVEREFYVNDAGNQITKLGLSLEVRYLQIFGQELGQQIEMPEDAYHGDDIIEHARGFAEIHGNKYVNSSQEDRRAALVEYALPRNVATLEGDLRKYRIEYDNWFRESTIHNDGSVERIIELLKAKGATYESDGALYLKSSDYGDEKDRVLVRSNGVVTYLVPDIAYHYNKLAAQADGGRNFDLAIDIFGADHHGYMARMNAALAALGIDTSRLKMLIMQMVRLVRAGETVKLSKRSGKAITLATLLEEVPVDAARFFFNLRSADTHLDFDLDLAVQETNQNPVYYVQYAHARICSVIRKLAEDESLASQVSPAMFVYTHGAEKELVRKLSFFPDEIEEAAKAFDPSRLTRYTTEVAQAFHKFYDACRVKGEQESVLQSRLALMNATAIVLRNALGILKVDAPERM
ncbi:MAG: arginine--tRNA ligase [Oscillospiraceae bacterium]|nr:arginine--tRNA ligase [Oscillospiraceae bacterium]